VVALPAVVIAVAEEGAAAAVAESATADFAAAPAVAVARGAEAEAAQRPTVLPRAAAAAEIRGAANRAEVRPFNRSLANRDRESPAAANPAGEVPRSSPSLDPKNQDREDQILANLVLESPDRRNRVQENPDQKSQDRVSLVLVSLALAAPISPAPKSLVPEGPALEDRTPEDRGLENQNLENPVQGRAPADPDLENQTTEIGPAGLETAIAPVTDPAGLATDRAMTTDRIVPGFHLANDPAVRAIVLRFNPSHPAGPIDRAIGRITAIAHRDVLPVIQIVPADVRRTGTDIGRTCIKVGTTGTGTAIGITAAPIGTPIRGAPGALPRARSASPPG
jgi:hypothetical protein